MSTQMKGYVVKVQGIPERAIRQGRRVEQRRATVQVNDFQCIRPFGLRGKWSPDHQYVSSAPSKIPYSGFSPVRLQTEFQPRPSSNRDFPLLRETIQSRGPWLPSGLCCPVGSSLTITSCELLVPSRQFMDYPAALCPMV